MQKRTGMEHFKLLHIELAAANEFVSLHHRHHKPVTGHRFSLACYDGDRLCGVAIVGRPVARGVDYTKTVEVLRICTDGTRNACSFLYGACKRAAKALGYQGIITYVLENESGVSLKASGFSFAYVTDGGSWNRKSRPRDDNAPICRKACYRADL